MKNTVTLLLSRSCSRVIPVLGTLLGLCLCGNAAAQESQHVEALGIVNGNMSVRSTLVDITVFLSGKPLFSSVTPVDEPMSNTLLVESATLVSREGKTLRLQQEFNLPKGGNGQLQVPVQVLVNGKPVTVSAQETSLGVELSLPEDTLSVAVVPVGAVQMTVPNSYRGDISLDIRIIGRN